jgi:hypothetical protein
MVFKQTRDLKIMPFHVVLRSLLTFLSHYRPGRECTTTNLEMHDICILL